MVESPVVFIGFKAYDNLGIGYLEAMLRAAGFRTKLLNLAQSNADIYRALATLNPQIVGFSVIFDDHILRFKNLIYYLRRKGVNCHLTAGGHYASLKFKELFDLIPQLDSIVKFEGENTMLELVKSISKGTDWRKTKGLAYLQNGSVISNKLRSFERDLDKFPFPVRSPLRKYAFDKKFATIIAGRGCVHNCSFCNTRKFYSSPPGSLKRIRKPEKVVDEMKMLFVNKDCRIFLFQDDDFPVKTKNNSDWIIEFCKELEANELNNKIMWKINCRPDEVNERVFSLMKRNGLYLVFIGIEDGTDKGLKRMNKCTTVAENLKGIKILKKLGIGFDFGFLLFQPKTTYDSLMKNLEFLKLLCCDGYTPVTFDKMMPAYETKLEKELMKAGRLKIVDNIADYDFLDDSMNEYYDFIDNCLDEWQKSPYGLTNVLRWVRNYIAVLLYYAGKNSYFLNLKQKFIKIISESNIFLLDTMTELSKYFESGEYMNESGLLESYRERINLKHEYYKNRIIENVELLSLYDQVYL